MNKMKTKKIMLMLSIVFVFLLIIGSASAADDIKVNQTDSIGDEVLTSDNNDVDLVSSEDTDENTDVLTDDNTVGSFSDLEKDINAEKGYQQTVYLTKDYVFNEDSDSEYKTTGVYIGSYTTIDGQNHFINAKNAQYIFNTIGQFITLKNIKFKNTSTRGINVGSADVSIIHCTFDNNTGRAVGIEDTGVDCLIDDCTFTNGQGVSTVATGTKIKNSVFENNYASNGGAVNIQSKEVIIDTCTFTGNNATNGGAIYFYYNNNNEGNEVLTIINSIFNENNANTGGAIYHQNKYIKTSSIYQNLGNIINITSSTFTKNRAVQYREIYGDYINDSSNFDGGRYYQNETSIFDGVTQGKIYLENNITLIRGPIVLDLDGALTIYGQGNTIDANGKQAFYINMYNSKGSVTFNNITIKNGHASEGGAVYIGSCAKTSTFYYCTFINNTATDGGAIYTYSNAAVGVLNIQKNSIFINNSATNRGGVAYTSASQKINNLLDSYFEGNSANVGGVIWGNRNAGPQMWRNTFINNYATSHAVYYNGKMSSLAASKTGNNVFRNNTAIANVLDLIPVSSNDIDDSNKIVLNLSFSNNCVINLTVGDYHVDGRIQTTAKNITLDGKGATVYGFNLVMNSGVVKNLILVNSYIRSTVNDISFENVTFINRTSYCLNLVNGGNVKDCVFINCTSPITSTYSVNITNTKFDDLTYNSILLDQLLKNSNTNNNVIQITPGEYMIVSTISIFGENIIIDGQGSTINSMFAEDVFGVYGKNITIKNFNIKNTNRAIFFQGWNNNNPPKAWVDTNFLYIGEVSSVNFINCTTGVYFNVANGTVSDCTFVDATGRQIYFGANGIVINSEFENITAYSGGASVYFKESGIVKDSNFTNTNAISAKGGAIYFNETVLLKIPTLLIIKQYPVEQFINPTLMVQLLLINPISMEMSLKQLQVLLIVKAV